MSTRRRKPKNGNSTDLAEAPAVNSGYELYEQWKNMVRYIEKKGQMVPQGCVIPSQLWRRFKRMVAQDWNALSEDNKELVRKMMEGL